ncbi:MAG: hypothetical protein KJ072_16765 [Verrucomicrobia bacterium]|nr:hypothetical protein [Verrucomicrobiota bacterium]
MNRVAPVLIGLLLVAGSGCRSVGPGTIPRDRYDYSGSISESWKRQTLLNIVKLRYLDPPIFVDVGQIVAGYSLETSGNLGGQLSSSGAIQGNSLALGTATRFTDRPTITYIPLTGDKFVKALITPLSPEAVFSTIESGWPAEAILFATLSRLNGLRNQEASATGFSQADPRFIRALELLGRIQAAGAVGLRAEIDGQRRQTTVVAIHSKNIPEQTLADTRELRELLGLSPDATEFKLVAGSLAANDRELALKPRSLMHILGIMAAQVEVPAEDVAQGRAAPGVVDAEQQGGHPVRLARILSSKQKPADAYVVVQYRDHWFWIEDDDLRSKRAFAFMMMLFTLTDSGDKQGLPVLTIPTQ